MKAWALFTFRSAAVRGCAPRLLADLESLVGVRFPDDYREFLLEVNGGCPVAHQQQKGEYATVAIDWQGKPAQGTDEIAIVRFLFVIEDWSGVYEEDRNEHLTLSGAYQTFVMEQRCLPQRQIPIGTDPGGSLFLIDTAEAGAVSFWARDWFDPEQQSVDPYHNVGSIAPTFSAFLNKIRFDDL